MRHIPGIDRSQVLLLPEAVDDYVGRDNPVRFIDAFVGWFGPGGRWFRARHAEGDGSSRLRSGGPAEALHIRLSQSGTFEPPAGGREQA